VNKTFVVAFSAWMLVATACGPKPETTTTAVPGVGTVTTTQDQDQTRITVEGADGQAALVTTQDQQQDQTRVTVEGPDGQAALVTTEKDGHSQGSMTVRGPEGDKAYSASNKVDEAAFSVPFYPGAKVEGGSQHEMAGPEGKTSKMATAELSTTDPVDQVVDFYVAKLPSANKMDSTVEGQRTVVLVPENPEQGTSVTIDQEEGGVTRIVLVGQGG